MAMLSTYERKARLTPGLFAAAPIVITVFTLGLRRYPVVSGAAAFLGAIGGPYLLAVLVARFGRAAERDLYEAWGGAPTTQLLRCSGPSNATQRDIWREALTKLTGVRLLTEKQERTNPAAADDAIAAAIGQVRYLGHGDGVPIVAAENAQYGLERNAYGFRHVARLISLLCGVGLVVALWFPHGVTRSAAVVGLALDLAVLLTWLLFPSADRTKDAGFRYANQLLHAVVNETRGVSRTAKAHPTGQEAGQ